MSRSYKKTPISKYGTWIPKSIANRRFRRLSNEEAETYMTRRGHRRHTNPWDINDCVDYWSKEQAIQDYYENFNDVYKYGLRNGWFQESYPTLESYLEYWKKCMFRK